MPFLKTEKGLRFEFADGLLRGTRWEISGKVCQSPTCGCAVLDLGFRPASDTAGEPPPQHRLSLDLYPREIVERKSTTDRDFTEALVSDLGEEDWGMLWGLFNVLKGQVYEKAALADQDFAFRFDEIEDEGLLVHYNEVFPYHNRLRFDVDGLSYAAVDQHCLRSSCRCADVMISFFPVTPDRADGPQKIDEQFAIMLELDRRRWHIEETLSAPAVPPKRIVAAFLDQVGYDLLAERRRILRALYRRNRDKTIGTVRRTLEKVGRNEPCPCGSGKKYKKCCGAK